MDIGRTGEGQNSLAPAHLSKVGGRERVVGTSWRGTADGQKVPPNPECRCCWCSWCSRCSSSSRCSTSSRCRFQSLVPVPSPSPSPSPSPMSLPY